jgi:hypothetical protein
MAKRSYKHSKETVKKLLKKHHGRLAKVADALNLSYAALWKRLKKDTELKEYQDHVIMSLVNNAEEQLEKLLYSRSEKMVFKTATYIIDRYDKHNGVGSKLDIAFSGESKPGDLDITKDTDSKKATEIYFKLLNSINKE